MGWVIIFACAVILLISLGLSIIEQIRAIWRGLRLLKQLMSKKDRLKNRANKKSSEMEIKTEDSNLFDVNRSQITQLDTLGSDSPVLNTAVGSPNPTRHPPRNMGRIKKIRRAQLAHRIRELRAMNS